jgi:hypothetical protein
MNTQNRLAAWLAGQIRATIFVAEPVQVDAEWWTSLTAAQPAVDERRPREGMYKVSGPFAGALLSIVSFAGRIDLLLDPAPSASGTIPVVTAGNGNELLQMFLDRLVPFAERVPEAIRIALAGTMLRETADRRSAYIELKSLLRSVVVDPDRMQELGYRINWPLKLLDNIDVNRITSWASTVVRMSAMSPEQQCRSPSSITFNLSSILTRRHPTQCAFHRRMQESSLSYSLA